MTDYIYLSTGIEHLDDLLAPDRVEGSQGGILIGRGKKRTEFETPIVVIEGTTGTGKTTLTMQIAHSAARDERWLVFFYSLEQTVNSLEISAENFGYFREKGEEKVYFNDLAEIKSQVKFKPNEANIYFCHLSPRPFTETDELDIFEQRFSELNHVFTEITSQVTDNETLILFILDSITAFSGRALQRNEIYRLFTLFRNFHIPAIITLEQLPENIPESDEVSFECTRFLADIVISLTKESQVGYLQYFIEIIKSRIGRQALGKHLYKIRTDPNAKNIKTDSRKGLVVYPSIHYVLSKVRTQVRSQPDAEAGLWIDDQEERDLGLIFNNVRIKSNSCTAIIGANGTHKLALGLNMAMARKEEGVDPNVLIISFGGAGDFGFQGVAWTDYNASFRGLEKIEFEDKESQIKFWHTYYSLKNHETPIVTITAFKIGQLTPEECFDVIERKIRIAEERKRPFTSVLLLNTAEICTGFPLLKSEILFLPTLLDLFVVHGLASVCIGVEDSVEAGNREANFTLLANADYRIVLSHYPTMNELSKGILAHELGDKDIYLKEQLVSLVLDNVTGKHYMRVPRWLWVQEMDKKVSNEIIEKVLHCTEKPKIV